MKPEVCDAEAQVQSGVQGRVTLGNLLKLALKGWIGSGLNELFGMVAGQPGVLQSNGRIEAQRKSLCFPSNR